MQYLTKKFHSIISWAEFCWPKSYTEKQSKSTSECDYIQIILFMFLMFLLHNKYIHRGKLCVHIATPSSFHSPSHFLLPEFSIPWLSPHLCNIYLLISCNYPSFCSNVFIIWISYITTVIPQHSVWIISLGIMVLRYIHSPVHDSNLSLLLNSTPLCIYTTFSISIHWWMNAGCFWNFSIMSCSAMKMNKPVSL